MMATAVASANKVGRCRQHVAKAVKQSPLVPMMNRVEVDARKQRQVRKKEKEASREPPLNANSAFVVSAPTAGSAIQKGGPLVGDRHMPVSR